MGQGGDLLTGAVVLLSGGLDSTTVASLLRSRGEKFSALTLDYSQRHSKEIDAAINIATKLGAAEHLVMKIDLSGIGGSALTDRNIDVPEPGGEGIPATYVPARNTIFLSLALAFAEARDFDFVYIGANAVDYSGYPDCRPEYIDAFNRMAALALKRGVEGRPVTVVAPLMKMSKAEIVRLGMRLNAPYELSWSCYRGTGKACGRCDSCNLRLKGFMEAGIRDPIEYENQ